MTLDAIVLLGCRVDVRGRLPGAARRRTARAAQLWHQRAAPWLVVSGGRRWGGVCEADAILNQLLLAGVSQTAIILERESRRTRENARYVAALLHARGATHIGVVTCDWHLQRASAAFRRVGFDVTGFPAQSPRAGLGRRLFRLGRERLSGAFDWMASGGAWTR